MSGLNQTGQLLGMVGDIAHALEKGDQVSKARRSMGKAALGEACATCRDHHQSMVGISPINSSVPHTSLLPLARSTDFLVQSCPYTGARSAVFYGRFVQERGVGWQVLCKRSRRMEKLAFPAARIVW